MFAFCVTLLFHAGLSSASSGHYLKLYGADIYKKSAQTQVSLTPQALADRVNYLPGWGEPHFGMFAGYVTVDQDAGRALYYIMAEAMEEPSTAPVFLWLNGGPGCSSIGGGFLSELGPYFPRRKQGKLQSNPNSWNRRATVIFLESPAFVGFSYSNTSTDSAVGDERTAQDAYEFLLNFMERFPSLKDRALWLSGESYGGHYVPNLAEAIVKGNKAGRRPALNLKGFIVGNAWTDPAIDNLGAIDFWHSHAIISTETAEGMRKYCDFNTVLDEGAATNDTLCDYFVDRSTREMGNINIYDIFADVCLQSQRGVVRQLAQALGGARVGISTRHALRDPIDGNDKGYDPCVDNRVEDYFNDPAVQAAIHANVSGFLPYRWRDCAPVEQLQYSREDVISSMLPVYARLLGEDLKILVYSGDIDAIVPVTGSRRWVEGLGLNAEDDWRPWMSSTGQVAGWTQRYSNGLTFASVRGAGHMVPYTQPERAFSMVTKFIHDEPL